TSLGRYGPIIVSKIHHSGACVGNQIDVIRGRVRLIKGVRKIYLQIKARERVPVNCLTDHMLFDFTAFQLGKSFALMKPLAVDRGMNKIVSRDERKRTQANRDIRSECNSNIQVVGVPVLVNQSWELSGYNILIIGRNSVKV